MEQKEPAWGWIRMSSVIKKYECLFWGQKVCWGSWCMTDHCTYCTCYRNIVVSCCFEAQLVEFSSQLSHFLWSTCICFTVYINRQDQVLSESEKDLWHNSSRPNGYSLACEHVVMRVIWQYVDILDQFPLTLVSVTRVLCFTIRAMRVNS